jgi:hypothetical protein
VLHALPISSSLTWFSNTSRSLIQVTIIFFVEFRIFTRFDANKKYKKEREWEIKI